MAGIRSRRCASGREEGRRGEARSGGEEGERKVDHLVTNGQRVHPHVCGAVHALGQASEGHARGTTECKPHAGGQRSTPTC
eukprot:6775343-Alexandrium_andersonii.AAC.1